MDTKRREESRKLWSDSKYHTRRNKPELDDFARQQFQAAIRKLWDDPNLQVTHHLNHKQGD